MGKDGGMRPLQSHSPYSLYKKTTKSGIFWYVRFWDEVQGKYTCYRSTGVLVEGKRERRAEAEKAALEMLPEIQLAEKTPDTLLSHYVVDFWTPNSSYIKECILVKKKPLSAYYIKMNHEDVRRHIEPFPLFHNLKLKDLKAGHIRDWMIWASEKGLSGRRVNTVLQSMRVAVRYAVAREELDRDPFLRIGEAPEPCKEKGILTPKEVSKLLNSPITNPYYRLAVLLGMLCGLRRGEVRGLQWQDIRDGLMYISHNWQDGEGLKLPKCGSSRIVPVPHSVQMILNQIRLTFGISEPDAFVFQSFSKSNTPIGNGFFKNAVTSELSIIGIGKTAQRTRNITFHGLRHTFVTLSRLAGISDLEIQALAGHKGSAMMDRYSHAAQVIDFDEAKRKIESISDMKREVV
jgi:integrase